MDENLTPEILIEWSQPYTGKLSVGKQLEWTEESQKGLNIAMQAIRKMADQVSANIREIKQDARPQEIEVEFGLKLECETGAVIPLIAKTNTGGHFSIKFKWILEKPDRPQEVLVADS